MDTLTEHLPASKRPCKGKRPVTDMSQFSAKLDSVLAEVSRINAKLRFMDDLTKLFECVVCKSICKHPVVAQCCQRLIGCSGCVERWLQSCPLCVTLSSIDVRYFQLNSLPAG